MRKSEVLAAEAVSCLNKAMIFLKDIWEEIGIQEEQRLQRTSTVKNHIKVLLDMMIAEEQSLKHRLEKSIELSRTEIHQLCLELELPPPQEERGLSCLQTEKDLRTRVDLLLREKSKRVQDLQDLVREDQELSQILGTPPFTINKTCVPSTRQLEDMRQHLSNQREEKSHREIQFQSLRGQILDLFLDLDRDPDSDLVQSDLNVFCLSTENLARLELLLRQLQARQKDTEAQYRALEEQVYSLWERLETPQSHREEFHHNIQGHTIQSRLNLVQSEAKRLQEMKLSLLKTVSERVRHSISDMWDKCFYNHQQRLEFSTFYLDEVSEPVLDSLEEQLQRLRSFYQIHQPLFENVQTWMNHWEQFLQLERKASDPSRFTNRGGNLLKEERQRSELSKSLHKLEHVLKAQISDWEQTESRPFLVRGLQFLEFVEQQWSLLQDQREKEKQERHLKKARQMEEDMLYGTTVRTPTKRRISPKSRVKPGLTQSPGFRGAGLSVNRTKRGLVSGCSHSSNSTLRSGQVSPGPRPPLCSNQIPLVRTPVRSRPPQTSDLIQIQAKEQENQEVQGNKENQSRGLVPQSPQSVGSVASTYSQFLRDLSDTNINVKHPLNSTDI